MMMCIRVLYFVAVLQCSFVKHLHPFFFFRASLLWALRNLITRGKKILPIQTKRSLGLHRSHHRVIQYRRTPLLYFELLVCLKMCLWTGDQYDVSLRPFLCLENQAGHFRDQSVDRLFLMG
ncbi:unnamed protein product [Acanthoscelides obtectus]|uniref:Secreted protein n=1 Tax=Acanthoscelides obtectus TaxID=200917 RepID=A0A9P0LJR4_ACAOB|nr:unnamed protein product [Acanthoscelides obtectus]CAK1662241.1 hypothetical protein AOBTE_LOCUS23051 [Acanthoscelides obtectus]